MLKVLKSQIPENQSNLTSVFEMHRHLTQIEVEVLPHTVFLLPQDLLSA